MIRQNALVQAELPMIGLWVYDREDSERILASAVIAQDLVTAPDLEALLVSARGDHITVQVVAGQLEDPRAILYVEQRGTFEIFRTEMWPGGRSLLVLRAWPAREPSSPVPAQ
jgi:hypothetical protein